MTNKITFMLTWTNKADGDTDPFPPNELKKYIHNDKYKVTLRRFDWVGLTAYADIINGKLPTHMEGYKIPKRYHDYLARIANTQHKKA